MKKAEWFKIKLYTHIGYPLTWRDKKKVCSYVKDEKKIAKHSFLPFIHKQIITRKLRKKYDKEGNVLDGGKRAILPPKIRDIYYSSHLDANIFGYYAHILEKKYSTILKEKKLEEVVTAYRKIPFNSTKKDGRNKCNIDFANDVFNFIKTNAEKDIVAVTFDIKSFFDNLNHHKLKKSWAYTLGVDRLDDAHYNVFRNITKFSFVEEKDLFKLFQNRIIVKLPSGVIKQKKVNRLKYLQSQGAIAFCEKKDIHLIRKKGLIRSNKYFNGKLRNFGICQGSPISSVLANIYMLDFDEYINNEVEKVNGYYRRYSDDMVIVCPKNLKEYFVTTIEAQIEKITKLEIQPSKTQIFHFQKKSDRIICMQEFDGKINQNSINRNFEYLGFSFDGETISIKTSTLAKYYRKMKLAVRRGQYYSSVINNKSRGQVFKRRLYKQYSHIGALRAKKYKRVRGKTNEWKVSLKYNWGNFITYAKLSAKTLDGNNVKKQIKNHWKNLNNEIQKNKNINH
ncbi:MAG: reverse transcriptase domain-containing protein [Chitinophagales bacterium]